MTSLARRRSRVGFTLVELLVVVIIIGLLMTMVAMAVFNGLRRAREFAIYDEIVKMAQGISSLQNEFGAYPPNTGNQKAMDTFLKKLRRRRSAAPAPKNLDAAQDLVFWLSRLSKDKTDLFGERGERRKEFNFDPDRLRGDSGGVPRYYPEGVDDQPYVYFHHASYKSITYKELKPYRVSSENSDAQQNQGKKGSAQYVEPESFQIISAGLDGDFGRGGTYPEGYDYTEADEDNIVSFDRKKLGDARP